MSKLFSPTKELIVYEYQRDCPMDNGGICIGEHAWHRTSIDTEGVGVGDWASVYWRRRRLETIAHITKEQAEDHLEFGSDQGWLATVGVIKLGSTDILPSLPDPIECYHRAGERSKAAELRAFREWLDSDPEVPVEDFNLSLIKDDGGNVIGWSEKNAHCLCDEGPFPSWRITETRLGGMSRPEEIIAHHLVTGVEAVFVPTSSRETLRPVRTLNVW